jgi:hypothetical protein
MTTTTKTRTTRAIFVFHLPVSVPVPFCRCESADVKQDLHGPVFIGGPLSLCTAILAGRALIMTKTCAKHERPNKESVQATYAA